VLHALALQVMAFALQNGDSCINLARCTPASCSPEGRGWTSHSAKQAASLIKRHAAAAAAATLLLLLLLLQCGTVHQVVALPLLHQRQRQLKALQGARTTPHAANSCTRKQWYVSSLHILNVTYPR
jgi:hypothetical protein